MPDHFKPLDRDTMFLLPPSIQDWLPADHLARYVVDLVGKLDMEPIRALYSGRGSAAYQPEMMVALLFYGYATGTYSSRKLERATYDSVAFRYITANQNPEHDTISDFRRRFLAQLQAFFEQILLIAAESGLLKVGRVSLDGTKIKANASKHHALSYGHATKLERRIKCEVERLLRLAEKADGTDVPDGLNIPAELAQRADRLRLIDEAKTRIKAREEQRIAAEAIAYKARMSQREARERESGKKTGGPKPKPPSRAIDPQAQVNLTDEESRVMPSKDGMVQAYNAQGMVDCASRLLVATSVSQKPTDRTLLEAAVNACKELPQTLGAVTELLADAGYYSAANVDACVASGITPYISAGREPHAGGLHRFYEPAPLKSNASAVEAMTHRLRTTRGRAIYGQRKATIETTFGIVKEIMRFRQFLLRGHEKVQGEWRLVGIGYNIKRLHRLKNLNANLAAVATC
jgi:transposase